MNTLVESEINIISTHARLEGKIQFEKITRVFGSLSGEIQCANGCELILMETSVVEGDIHGDTVIVEGYVKGDIVARTKVLVSPNGRVLGNIKAPSVSISFGAFFEGQCRMEQSFSPQPA